MPPVRFEPTISASERPADLRLRPRGHWDRLVVVVVVVVVVVIYMVSVGTEKFGNA